MFRGIFMGLVLCIALDSPLALAEETPSWPFNYSTHYLGKFNIQGRTDNWTYDLFPDFYQVDSLTNVIEWLGMYSYENGPDIPRSTNYTSSDRVYRAETKGPLSGWTTRITDPEVSYKGWYGDTGKLETEDHLVGNPSTVKVGGKYYRFVETYGNWLTKINTFYSPTNTDNFPSSGRGYNPNTGKLPEQPDGYAFQNIETLSLGFAPAFQRRETRPIYRIKFTNSAGQVNHFPSTVRSSFISDLFPTGWRVMHGGNPMFYLYKSPAPGLIPLYLFYNQDTNDTYITASSTGGSVVNAVPDGFHATGSGGLLGYSVASIYSDKKPADGCNQNRVRMQISLDGKNWKPFSGSSHDGALIVPIDPTSCKYPHAGTESDDAPPEMVAEKYDIFRRYGSGFPQALVRDGYVELYFTDDTLEWEGKPEGNYPPIMKRKRVKVEDVENAEAWDNARLEDLPVINVYTGEYFSGPQYGPYFHSVKWSNYLKRYVDFTVSHTTGKPGIVFTHKDLRKGFPPIMIPPFTIEIEGFPVGEYDVGKGSGAILGNLDGNTLDLPDSSVPHIALHLIFTASEKKWGGSYFKQDFHHALVLIYL